ncbi:MAG: hypothetical protein AAF196_16815 [Planctomycetota bacterium]
MIRSLLTVLFLPAALFAQQAAPTPDASEARAPVIGVIGASVSDGFRLIDFANRVQNAEAVAQGYLGRRMKDGEFDARTDSTHLQAVLAPGYDVADWHRNTDLWMFSAPMRKAQQQIAAVREAGCELVYAVDLPFWFAYGATGVRGRDDEAKQKRLAARLERFQTFLDLCEEQFGDGEQQVVLGDIPDLSRARMLITRPQVPTVEERQALNDALRAFVDEREWCHLFSLAQAVDDVRAGLEIEVDGRSFVADESNSFQLALVHPTRLGVCLLAERVLEFASTALPEGLRPEPVPLADLLQAAGVEAPWTGKPGQTDDSAPADEDGGDGEPSAESTTGRVVAGVSPRH